MKREPRAAKIKFKDQKAEGKKQTHLKLVGQKAKFPEKYKEFSQLDGTHPWQTQVPEGYIGYQARVVEEAEVAYFNYDLAIEMGLLPKNHPHKMTKDLKDTLVETFGLVIINEYDLENGISYAEESIKPNLYMATRYLQLQHPNKQGKTSGDGRSIWNGVVKKNGKIWDVSSRGTGVTALAPGIIEAGKNLQTGSEEFGYGCGLAEIDELYATAIMSEIFHKKGVPTERTLLVLETGPGVGIGVRAGENLLRPAHLFSFLKQNNHNALKRAFDYYIDRQVQNKKFVSCRTDSANYNKVVKEISESYAKFVAKLESEYIFAWFDWDGDNMLMDIGILDYGSIRQFGIRHDEYRYDDVSRYSTNLNEQKIKARKIVQCFCQILDFLNTGKRKALKEFDDHKYIKLFDKSFDEEMIRLFESKLGLDQVAKKFKHRGYKKDLKNLHAAFFRLESHKVSKQIEAVDDGINKPPFFNARSLIRLLTSQYVSNKEIELDSLFDAIQSEYSVKASQYQTDQAYLLMVEFCDLYLNFMGHIELSEKHKKALISKVEIVNHPDRITGNSITYIVTEIMALRSKNLAGEGLQKFIELFIYNQLKKTQPDLQVPKFSSVPRETLKIAMHIVREHYEDI
ncbi:MAG: hypothetical protein VX642_02675 [Bdellovibrionota bacterium]|nr:hypothetical protein [Bdellovibrionota bacterium]